MSTNELERLSVIQEIVDKHLLGSKIEGLNVVYWSLSMMRPVNYVVYILSLLRQQPAILN